jgi:hypothetical protein
MALVMVPRWTHELGRLLVEEGPQGARDLAMRHWEVGRWFAGGAADGPLAPKIYPPASYAILWPFVGWLDLAAARWLWAATLLAALAWLTAIVVRESGAESRLERAFLVAWVPAMYATTVTVGNGQLGLHVLAAVLSSILVGRRGRGAWTSDLAAALLFTLALVKPSLAAPFFWVLLTGRGGARRGALVVAAYAGLTALAVSVRPEGMLGLLRSWLSISRETALGARYGYMNLHEWMSAAGAGEWIPYGSLLALLLLGAWVRRHRGGPVWLALGVAAIVARTWTYHALYDDLLLLVPIVALVRAAHEARAGEGPCRGDGSRALRRLVRDARPRAAAHRPPALGPRVPRGAVGRVGDRPGRAPRRCVPVHARVRRGRRADVSALSARSSPPRSPSPR